VNHNNDSTPEEDDAVATLETLALMIAHFTFASNSSISKEGDRYEQRRMASMSRLQVQNPNANTGGYNAHQFPIILSEV
jgi:hypothetical protein